MTVSSFWSGCGCVWVTPVARPSWLKAPRCFLSRCADRNTTLTIWLIAGVLLTTLPGCNVVGFFIQALFPQKINAKYRLADRPTLILVDDPADLLGNHTLVNEIANHAAFHLTENKVLTDQHVIDPRSLYDLAARLGSRYARTPIDQIGRELGADQVIHIYVALVKLIDQPGLLRPTATVHVKVIDTEQGKRLYPSAQHIEVNPTAMNHQPVNVALRPYTFQGDGRDKISSLSRKLAKRIGRDTARLFYDHLPRQPGDPLED